MPERKTIYIGVRVTPTTHRNFVKRIGEQSDARQSEILREMIDALIENRITIKPAIKEIVK